MPIQIGQKPSPTFQQPLELLSDCHRRVENFLKALIMVAEQAFADHLTEPQREALQTALRYFREAAPKHTADEEESLFPRLREMGGEAAREALAKVEQLEEDHKVARVDHDLVEELGQKWLSPSGLASDERSRMLAALYRLKSIYDRHIAIEDNEVFPIARNALPADALKAVGREMAERRGQSFERQFRPPHL